MVLVLGCSDFLVVSSCVHPEGSNFDYVFFS